MLKQIWREVTSRQFISYTLVGFLGAAIDYSSFFILLHFGTHILIAQWLSGFLAFSHNHVWHHFKVFDHNQKFKITYPLSLLLSIISIILSGPLLLWFDQYFHVFISKILVSIIMIFAVYLVRRKWIFVNNAT